jgi:putative Mg2+ transporter-C (MgtC) family protein
MNPPLTTADILMRLLAATLAGALMGWERERHGRAAGLRTTILTCVASAVAMIISEFLFAQGANATPGGNWRPDPARLAAGVLTGIGFLGAGTILRHNDAIRGVTTAASLWFVTLLGLAFGNGQFLVGTFGLGIALPTLMLLPLFEKHIRSDWYATLSVTTELDALNQSQLEERLKALGLKIKGVELNYDLAARQKTISCEVKLERHRAAEFAAKAVADLRQCPGVLQIRWK